MMPKIKDYKWYIIIVIAIVLFDFFFFNFVVKPIQVSGPSMNPNLHDKEKVWAFKSSQIKRGSVIVFFAKGTDPEQKDNLVYVKRVIGLPGDKVESKNGKLFVNDKLVNQSYISPDQRDAGTGNWSSFSELSSKKDATWKANDKKNLDHVPQKSYFVLGDNRKVSNDSRYFGYVPEGKIIGVVKSPWFFFNSHRYEINRYADNFFVSSKDNRKPDVSDNN